MRAIAGVGIAALAVLAAVVVLAVAGCGDGDTGGDAAAPPPPTTTAAVDPAGIMLADSGSSVAEALATDIDGTFTMRAYAFVAEDGSARLCDAILESDPPQCGGADVVVTGLTPEFVAGLTEGGGGRWSEAPVQLMGTLQGDVFVNDPVALAAG